MHFTICVNILFLTLYAANGFLVATHHVATSKTIYKFRLPLYYHQQQHISSADEKKKPMIVIGNPSAALGAGLALCSMDVLRQKEGFDRRKPIPPAQLLAFYNVNQDESNHSKDIDNNLQTCLLFGQYRSSDAIQRFPTLDEFQDIFGKIDQFLSMIYADSSQYDSPILHTTLNHDIMTTDDIIQSLVDPKIRNGISFLGMDVKANVIDTESAHVILSKDEAILLGDTLNKAINHSTGQHSLKAAVISDLQTHLAMLHANSLPNSKDMMDDCWIVHNDMKDGSSLLFEYQFDYNNPMGGTDPLLCVSYGYSVSPPVENISTVPKEVISRSNDALAAAYSAMIGSGMDPLSSLCVATSVKAVYIEMESKDNSFCTPSYSWETVMKVADYSRKARQTINRDDGKSRKMYKEFGYK
jgi:hypothetical protein